MVYLTNSIALKPRVKMLSMRAPPRDDRFLKGAYVRLANSAAIVYNEYNSLYYSVLTEGSHGIPDTQIARGTASQD